MPFNLTWNFLETPLKFPRNFLETLLKHSWNFFETLLKHLWNTLETSLKLPWNTLETSTKLQTVFKLPWNTIETLLTRRNFNYTKRKKGGENTKTRKHTRKHWVTTSLLELLIAAKKCKKNSFRLFNSTHIYLKS